jgi:TonB family protein
MKALTVQLGLFLLLAAGPAVAQTADNGIPSGPTPDNPTAQSSEEARADLYEKFVVNRIDNADFAYETAKKYISTYEPVDGSDNQYVAYLKKWVALYEKLAQEREKFSPDDLDIRVYGPKDVTEKARILFKPEPIFTEEARIKGVRGTVILKAVFRADGRVTDIKTVAGLPSGLTKSAVEAARQITFSPAVKDGRLVSQFVKIKYNFNLY